MSNMEAISGLLVNNDYMEVISNNIANASTIGYKSSKPVFFDIFSDSLYSNNSKGFGVGISNIVQNFDNGTLIETGRDLDLGIVKDGFFRVLDPKGRVHYTRNGQFLLDNNKNIVNMQGMYLTGQNKSYSKNGVNNISNLEPINLKHADILQAQPTSEIKFNVTLNSTINPINEENNSGDNEFKPEEYTTHFNIYTQDGQEEQINISFNKTEKNKWKVSVKSNESSNKTDIDSSFDLKFNTDGELISNPVFNIPSKNPKHKNITLDLNNSVEQSNTYSLGEISQNGYAKGTLQTFNILPNGEIIGTYSNHQTLPIGQILLSKFINPEKLQPESGNIWSVTEESGPENIGIAGDLGFGVLTEKSLEASNVDLNKELINMIIAQRNYQSNAQSFKTEDKIINTLINLK